MPLAGIADLSAKGDPSTDSYIVVLNYSVDRPGRIARAQLANHGGSLGFVYRSALKGYSAELSDRAVAALERDPRVKYVEADRPIEAFAQTVPTGIKRISAAENATLDIDGVDDKRVDVDVAVLDSGIDAAHPDLNVVDSIDCRTADKPVTCFDGTATDVFGHGTHVAGTIGAIDNGQGVVGVAPGARLWAVKVLADNGAGEMSWAVAGVDWVTTHASQIEVANMSLGGTGDSQLIDEAISRSVAAGVVYVVSAGNDERNAVSMTPANGPDVITVSALADYDGLPGGKATQRCADRGPDDTLAQFSNWGNAVEIAAPGVCVLSTLPGGKYGSLHGTSMASPHVAGAAAAIASQSNPSSRQDVEAIRRQLIDGGSLEWNDTALDEKVEPLLHFDDIALAGTEVATAGAATAPGVNAVTVSGSSSPRVVGAEYRFEYGTSAEYGQATAMSALSGAGHTTVKTTLNDLKPDQRYHYRLVVTTNGGAVYGPDRTFVNSRWSDRTPPRDLTKQSDELLTDVSCTSASFCMAVGEYGQGVEEPIAYRWASNQWSPVSVPMPQDASDAYLEGVSCTSATACTAVGYTKENGAILPLVERWDGAKWVVQDTSRPFVGAPDSRLLDVWCVSASECMAVGVMRTYEPWKWSTFSTRWSNGVWTPISTPILGGSESDWFGHVLEGVSCASPTFCMAVGRYFREPHATSPKVGALRWNGSSWVSHPPTSGVISLSSVSCPSSSFCVAVGSSGSVELWSAGTWSWSTHSVKNMGSGGFHDVSCVSSNECTASGYEFKNGATAVTAGWDGETWRKEAAPPRSESADRLEGVSCVALAGCKIAGYSKTPVARALMLGRGSEPGPPAVESDLDADGRSDLFALHSEGGVEVHRGTAQGVSTTALSSGSSFSPALYDGVGEYLVDSADVDGDRQADLITVSDSGAVTVRSSEETALGAAIPSDIAMPPAFSRAGHFEPIAVADVNGDRRGDLVAYDGSPDAMHVAVHLGRSSGTFAPFPIGSLDDVLTSALFTGQGDYFLDVADVDGDGYADLVTHGAGGIKVHRGSSGGYFTPAGVTAAVVDPIMDNGSGQEPVGLGDVTGDGKADLVTVSAGKLKLYTGQAAGGSGITFGAPSGDAYSGTIDSNLLDGTGEDLIGLIDYNGDGRADLVSSTASGAVKSYAGQSNGTFSAPVVSSAIPPSARHNVIPAYEFAIERPIVRRQGCEASGCRWVAQGLDGDVDGDRHADLTTLHTSGSAYVFAGQASGSISASSPSTSFGGAVDPAVQDGVGSYPVDTADVTGDGRSDFVTIDSAGGVSVYPGQTSRAFGAGVKSLSGRIPAELGGNFEPIGVADVTGDGRGDMVANESLFGIQTLVVYAGQASGGFNGSNAIVSEFGSADSALLDGSGDYYLDAADVSGDGLADLVSLSASGVPRVFRARLGGSFSTPVASNDAALDPIMSDGVGHEPVGLGDVDSDGRADLVVQDRNAHVVVTLRGHSNGTFEAPIATGGGWAPARSGVNSSLIDELGDDLVGLFDVGGDGHADLLSVSTNEEIRVYAGRPDGGFEAPRLSGPLVSNRHDVAPGHEMASEKPAWRRRPSVVPTTQPTPWAVKEIDPASIDALDITCVSESSCVAVGVDGGHAKIVAWQGTAWSEQAAPVPAEATSSKLTGVSCTSAAACTAVGSYLVSGAPRTLVLRWDGGSWSIASSPNPGEENGTELDGVSCPTPSFCVAVGSYQEGSSRVRLVLRGVEGAWSMPSVDSPFNAASSELSDVSCVSVDFCTAVGSYVDGGTGERRAMVMDLIISATFGALPSLPAPANASATELNDLSCVADGCTAVGSYTADSIKTLVMRRGSSSWSLVASPSPFTATSSSLTGLFCSSTTRCAAVGETIVGGASRGLAMVLDGDWLIEDAAVPAGASEVAFNAVSCVTVDDCHAVGSSEVGGAARAFGSIRG